MRAPLSAAIAIAVGLVTLLGYFIPVAVLQNVRMTLIQWTIILAGVAGLVAIIHLLRVHWRKVTVAKEKDITSGFMLLAFFVTFIAGIILGPNHPAMQKVVTHIQMPVEASLMAVVAISLVVAGIRFVQHRKGVMAIVFIGSTILFLIIGSGILAGGSDIPLLKNALSAISVLPVAGMRGILLGVALGSLTTGLRILLGADRPYSG